ncbi:uncharacterized protein EI90DRAFT_3135353 [Cantharellus anzutake]|uniref:uncharacterized protein n=1 Tax=Cantharellus anzutake TaxID=1750568 RepID=UPI0019067518|nr:uncharacterized protein EI90DRAFT_3135353 [Cantharellus anzutake]KAF8315293.1 hypothetical protein EI90DRAFT_3135353 [Cantharellus anzutake]
MASRETTPSDLGEDLQPIRFPAYVRKAFRLDSVRTPGGLNIQFEQLLLEGKNDDGRYYKLDTADMKTNLSGDDAGISLHRDFDSIIGFYQGLPLFDSVELSLVPRPMDSLSGSTNLHVKLPDHLFEIVSLSVIHTLTLTTHFHPELFDSYPSTFLAFISPYRLLGGILSRTKDGKLVGGKRLVSAALLGELVEHMRDCLERKKERFEWARSFFFGLEIKGIKLSTTHPVPFNNGTEEGQGSSEEDQETIFRQLILGMFHSGLTSLEQQSTWVDVGLEISRKAHVLHWDASEHHRILQVLATGYQGDVERQWTQPGREGYFCDIQAGILSLAGGRCALPHLPRLPIYAQWYASEKGVCRRADRFDPMLGITKKNVFGEKTKDKLRVEFDNLEKVWNSAHHERTEGTARLEIRIPLRKAKNSLRTVTKEFIEQCTMAIQASDGSLARHALELSAALTWRINMLNRRPAAGSSEHQLMCASLPVTDNFSHPDLLDGRDRNPWRAQAENEEYRPFASGNVIWFRDIDYNLNMTDDWHRPISPGFKARATLGLGRRRLLLDRYLKHLSSFTIDELERILSTTPYITPPAPFHLPRPNHTLPPDLPESLDELLANAHIKLKESATKHLKDSFPNSDNSDGVPQLVQGTTNLVLTKNIQQILDFYFSNVLQTIPVPQTQSPELFYHTVRNPDSPVAHPGIGYFKEPDLFRSGFTGAHIRKRNPPEFHVVFQLSFPPADLKWEEARMKGTYNRERRGGQPMRYGDEREQGLIEYKNGGRGWKRHSFHAAWWEFIQRFDYTGGDRIREKVWKNVYSKLVWAPYSDLSQMWYTTSNAKSAETFPADMAGQRLPIIILNPLIDDKAMWDGSLIRRREWVSLTL